MSLGAPKGIYISGLVEPPISCSFPNPPVSRTKKGRFIMLAAVLLFMLSACVDVSRQSPVRRDARSPKTYAPNNSSRSSRRLSFNQDGTFQISIFEDLHFGESETLPQTPSRTWLVS